MKKKISLILIFMISLILGACTNQNPEELTDLILTPKTDTPLLEGTWQVTNVDDVGGISNVDPPEVGDKLYINDQLVAINNEYAFPPSFSAKYVNLNDYLKNRGFEFDKINKDEQVIVVNASQGQYFSRDIVKRSDDEIFYIADDNLVYLSRLSNSVDPEIISHYTSLANNERIKPAVNEATNEDITLLLGVRERIDLEDGKQDYNYYTYMIRIPEDENISYKKASDIFLRGQDEYWKVRSNKSPVYGTYNSIDAFPARLESQMDIQDQISRYSFRDFDMNIRLNFVDTDYISFSYTGRLFDSSITKYGFLETTALDENRLVTIEEFTGDSDATEQFENMIINETKSKAPEVDTKDIDPDPTNFGLVRDAGMWVIQTSLYTDQEQIRASSQLPIRNYVEEANTNKSNITRDQVRNINSQFKDFHILNNGNYIVIQVPDEILIHRVNDNLIEKKPFFSIPTPNPTGFISIDQQSGSNAEALEKAFINSNSIIAGN